ncbi:hypothetical protein DFP79_1181 [Marinomonas balearica]|uniref:Uncharacterized protein n=1 Tax=Marinomonas balearica TaxID=491947 RepID=A0A4R6MFA1_9GAMM|nr:hypothetical protein DFP79_1181 [Marinomonas balearica]
MAASSNRHIVSCLYTPLKVLLEAGRTHGTGHHTIKFQLSED